MSKFKTAILIFAFALMAALFASCAPRIYGARPHRRDRHCGCEYVAPDAPQTLQQNI